MTLRAYEYGDPSRVCENKEYFSLGCGACACHKPKPDRSEFECIAECKQWPEGSNRTCVFFVKKKRVREPNRKDSA
jgi:hypothetical protein